MADDNNDDPVSDALIEADAEDEVREPADSADEADHRSGNEDTDFADQFQLMKNTRTLE